MPDRDYYLSERRAAEGHSREVPGVRRRICSPRRHAEAADASRTKIVAHRNRSWRSRIGRACRIATRRKHTTVTKSRTLPQAHARLRLERVLRRRADSDGQDAGAGGRAAELFRSAGQGDRDTSVADWRGYFRYKLLDAYAPRSAGEIRAAAFRFQSAHRAPASRSCKPRWKRAVETVEGAVGDLVGKMYVERHFSPRRQAPHGRAGRQSDARRIAQASTRSNG